MPVDVKTAKYYPELVQEAGLTTLILSTTTTITRGAKSNFKPLLLEIAGIAYTANNNVSIWMTQDGELLDEIAGALGSLTWEQRMNVLCDTSILIQGQNATVANITNYAFRYAYWIFKPNVAEKLKYKIAPTYDSLLPSEKEAVKKLNAAGYNILQMIEDGTLPIPREIMMAREFQCIDRYLLSDRETVATTGLTLCDVYPRNPDEFLVLEAVRSTTPATVTDGVMLHVTRDTDTDYVSDFDVAALDLTGDTVNQGARFWIPAMDELRVTLEPTVAQANHSWALRYGVYKKTLNLKVKWGLEITPAEENIVTRELLREKAVCGLI